MSNPISKFSTILQNLRALYRYPPGHFYSPLNDVKNINSTKQETSLKGIDLREAEQIELLEKLKEFYHEMPFSKTEDSLRYSFGNPFFCESDGTMLYSFLRYLQPKKLVEVGSGYSSALMLDTAQQFNLDTKFTFIEPYPERLYGVIKNDDKQKTEILEQSVQSIPIHKFEELEENDVLFIDSSHVSKHQSDVNFLFFEVLPSLKKGVVIHIHDIFYPFDYPKAWIERGRAWNEGYLLKAFLQYNHHFQIELFNDYIINHKKEWFKKKMPLCLDNSGGSIWLKKIV